MQRFLLTVLIFLSLNSSAVTDFGVRARSMAGAYRAVANSNNIIPYNPSGLLKIRRIEIDADFQINQAENYRRIMASAMDSKLSSWGLGLMYIGDIPDANQYPMKHRGFLTSSMPILSDLLALGASWTYFYDPDKNIDDHEHFFNLDAGLLLNTYQGLSLALVLDHLLPKKGREKGMGLSMGMAFDFSPLVHILPLTLATDWIVDNITSDEKLNHTLAVGLEYIALNLIPFRIGISSDFLKDEKVFSIGSGLIIKSFSLDGLFVQNLSVGKNREWGIAARFSF